MDTISCSSRSPSILLAPIDEFVPTFMLGLVPIAVYPIVIDMWEDDDEDGEAAALPLIIAPRFGPIEIEGDVEVMAPTMLVML